MIKDPFRTGHSAIIKSCRFDKQHLLAATRRFTEQVSVVVGSGGFVGQSVGRSDAHLLAGESVMSNFRHLEVSKSRPEITSFLFYSRRRCVGGVLIRCVDEVSANSATADRSQQNTGKRRIATQPGHTHSSSEERP